MATRFRLETSGGKKPAAKTSAPQPKAAASGPAAAAGAEAAVQAKKAPRSRKRTAVNAETAKVLRDAEAGKNLLHYPSLEAMFEDLGI